MKKLLILILTVFTLSACELFSTWVKDNEWKDYNLTPQKIFDKAHEAKDGEIDNANRLKEFEQNVK